MDLIALVSSLESHGSVISFELKEDHTTYLFYTLTYFRDITLNLADQQSVCLLVQDRGLPTEVAYFKGSYPAALRTSPSFKDEVRTKILQYQATKPTLEHFEITDVNENEQVAFVQVYLYDSTANHTERIPYMAIKIGTDWHIRKLVL